MKVQSEASILLSERSLGLWPLQSQETGGALLPTLLHAELQLSAFLHNNALPPFEPLNEKSSVVEQCLAETLECAGQAPPQSLELLLANVNAAHALLLTGDVHAAQKLLDVPVSAVEPPQALAYKRLFLLSRVHAQLQNSIAEKQALLAAINAFPSLPTPSNIEASQWLYLTFDRFRLLSPQWTMEQLSSQFTHHNFIFAFINYTGANPYELEASITNRANTLLKKVSFPRADEKNNYELEEFIDLITQSPIVNASKYTALVEAAIAKTYQSHIVLRSYIRCLLEKNNEDEIKAAVEVYAEYIQSYYEQNGHTYLDIVSILQVYDLLLNSFVKDVQRGVKSIQRLSSKNYSYWLQQLSVFRSLLQEFYTAHGIQKVVDVDIVKILTHSVEGSPISLSQPLRSILSELWRTLGNVTFLLHHSPHSIYSNNKSAIDESVEDYKHAIYLAPDNSVTVLQYVKQIVELRKVKEAYRVLRTIIQSFNKSSLEHFEAWHLLALILSVEENKDEAYKVINFINAEINELLEPQENSAPIMSSLKVAFTQIKMSQLAIIEALFGIEQTLDSLPELFELFHKLFSSDIISSKSEQDSTLVVPNQHKRSLSLARTQTLSKIKSTITHTKQSQLTPESKPQPLITIKSTSYTAKLTLQKIWLFAATIYSKLSLYEDAELAIVEAESVNGPSSETHSALALLTSSLRPELSLKEFEKALVLNRLSLKALIGFSSLVLSRGYDEKQVLFISKKDRYAAIARAKILLETSSETLEGAYTTEVWWLLAKIYQYFEDPREKNALWKSVELEETRPVRAFESVNTFAQ